MAGVGGARSSQASLLTVGGARTNHRQAHAAERRRGRRSCSWPRWRGGATPVRSGLTMAARSLEIERSSSAWAWPRSNPLRLPRVCKRHGGRLAGLMRFVAGEGWGGHGGGGGGGRGKVGWGMNVTPLAQMNESNRRESNKSLTFSTHHQSTTQSINAIHRGGDPPTDPLVPHSSIPTLPRIEPPLRPISDVAQDPTADKFRAC